MAEIERFSWQKYLAGIIEPLNLAKSTAHILQLCLVTAGLLLLLKFVVLPVKNFLFPKKAPAPVVSYVSGGKVDGSANKSQKMGVIVL